MAGRKPKYTDEQLLELRAKGLSYGEVAKALGVSVSSVAKRCRALIQKQDAKVVPEPKPEQLTFAPAEPEQDAQKAVPAPSHVRKSTPKKAAIETSLFRFAYVPVITEQLHMLSCLADPEPWAFAEPGEEAAQNTETPILEAYIRDTFRQRAEAYNATESQEEADSIFYIDHKIACFHTGLYKKNGDGLFALFLPNLRPNVQPWFAWSYGDSISTELRRLTKLPKDPRDTVTLPRFDPSKEIRFFYAHMFHEKNIARLPEQLKASWNAELLIQTAVELTRRRSIYTPNLVEVFKKNGADNFLLPLYITNPDTPDLAAVLEQQNTADYYICKTCLTPKQAYLNVRQFARPSADWLKALVTPTRTG